MTKKYDDIKTIPIQNKQKQKVGFKPAIATSLAFLLNLGGGMAYAQASTEVDCGAMGNCQEITKDLTFYFDTKGNGTSVDPTGGKVTFGSNVNMITLSDKNFTHDGTTNQNGVFNFPDSTLFIDFAGTNSKTFNLKAENDKFIGNLRIAAGEKSNTFNGTFTQGFKGNIEFRGKSTYNITLGTMPAAEEEQQGLSIEGDIVMGQNVTGTMTIDLANEKNKIVGNIHRYAKNVYDGTSGTNDARIIIKNGTLEGQIGGDHINTNKNAKQLNIDLVDGAKMVGTIQTGLANAGNDFVGNYITFGGTSKTEEETVTLMENGATTTYLTGDITSYGTGHGSANKEAGNHVTFEKGIMEGNILAAKTYNSDNITRYGYNNVVFKQEGITLDKLNIESTGGTNEIEFKNGVMDMMEPSAGVGTAAAAPAAAKAAAATDNGKPVTFIGNIAASGGGTNTITFEQNGVIGKMDMSDTQRQTMENKQAKITTNGGTNSITFKEGGKILNTKFEAYNKGVNTVNFITTDNTKNQILLLGDITTQGGNNNFKFDINTTNSGASAASEKDNSNPLANAVFAGNILTDGGATRMIFDDSFWVPNNVSELSNSVTREMGSGQSNELMQYLANNKNKSGEIVTRNSGGTTIVLREKSGHLDTGNRAANFKITNAGGSTTNVVIQAPINVSADVDYAGRFDYDDNYIWDGSGNTGIVNIVFANSNNLGDPIPGQNGSNSGKNVQDDFTSGSDNNFSENKFLGVNYKDGLRFALKDRNVTLQDEYGTYSASFTGVFKEYLESSSDRKSLLKITVDKTMQEKTREKDIAKSYKDKITLDGIAVGSIIALESSKPGNDNSQMNGSNYTIELTKNSIFFGDFDYSKIQTTHDNKNPVKVDMVMKEGSKLLVPGGTNIINLTFDSAPMVDPADPNLLLNTIAQKNTIVDIGSYGNDASFIPTRTNFNLLQIGEIPQKSTSSGSNGDSGQMLGKSGLKGDNAIFRVYVNTDAFQGRKNAGASGATLNNQSSQAGNGTYGHIYSDRIIVHDIQKNDNTRNGDATKAVTEYVQILTSGDVNKIKYVSGGTETAGNIAIMTVKQGTMDMNAEGTNDAERKASVNLKSTNAVVGFDVFSSELIGVTTDKYGKTTNMNKAQNGGNYTTYFIKDAKAQTSNANKDVSSSALSGNYQLYLANLNSLNKRMGELRDNANAHGVWARVFTGMQTSNFATQSTSYYTTIQGGYDYAFGMEGANNYLGFAISYANSVNKTDLLTEEVTNHKKGINSSISNGAEIAIYNAYVQDGASKANGFKNGLYSDTVLKLSFINNRLSFFNESGNDSVNNFAFTLSQELGYRFLLGEKNEWYIDPQAEIALGFLDQSNLRRVFGAYHLDGIQNTILTLRGRIGSSFGYKFDRFTQDKGFRSQLYVGTYYTGDYIHGGSINLTSSLGSNSTFAPLTSTGRFTLNIGTNFTIKDHHRIYFDFERSFGGKIVTQYQFNLGYRYSFGENKKYIPTALAITSDIKKDKKQKTEDKEEAAKN